MLVSYAVLNSAWYSASSRTDFNWLCLPRYEVLRLSTSLLMRSWSSIVWLTESTGFSSKKSYMSSVMVLKSIFRVSVKSAMLKTEVSESSTSTGVILLVEGAKGARATSASITVDSSGSSLVDKLKCSSVSKNSWSLSDEGTSTTCSIAVALVSAADRTSLADDPGSSSISNKSPKSSSSLLDIGNSISRSEAPGSVSATEGFDVLKSLMYWDVRSTAELKMNWNW